MLSLCSGHTWREESFRGRLSLNLRASIRCLEAFATERAKNDSVIPAAPAGCGDAAMAVWTAGAMVALVSNLMNNLPVGLIAGSAIEAGHINPRFKPSFYAVSTEDRTINPDLERFMAKRMGATTIEVKASHLSLISQPEIITNLILQATAHT
jgi:hypothetical protein